MADRSRFPGMGGSGDPGSVLPGGDPIVPPNLLASMVAQQVNKIATEVQQEAMLAGHSKKLMETKVEHFLTKMVTEALEKADRTAAGHQQMLGLRDWTRDYDTQAAQRAGRPTGQSSSPTPATAPAPPRHQQPQEGAAPVRPGTPPEPAPERATIKQGYSEGREAAQGATWGSVAKKVSGVASEYISERTANWQLDEDTGEYVHYDDQGNERTRVSPSDAYNYAKVGRMISRNQSLTDALGRFAAGRPLAGATLGSIAKMAGPIGVGVAAYKMGTAKFQEQYDKQQPYVQTFGQQGTGYWAAAERFGEFKSGIRGSLGLSRMSGDRAREQFRATSALGLRGGAQDQAREFAGDMYLRFGMDTADAMEVVKNSITDGNLSLYDYGTAIREVSKAAVESGRVSQDAVRDMIATQHMIATQVVSGNASVGISRDISQIVSGLPQGVSKAMGGVEGIGQMLGNDRAMQMIAMQTGTDPLASQWRLRGAGGATAEREAGRLLAGGADVIVERMAAFWGMTKQQLQAEAREEAGGERELSPDQRTMLWERWSQGSQRTSGMAMLVLEGVMRLFGQADTEAVMIETFFQMALGSFDARSTKDKRRGDPDSKRGPSHKPVGTSGAKVTTRDPWGGGKTSTNIKYGKGSKFEQEGALLSSMGYQKTYQSQGAYGGSVAVQAKPEDLDAFKTYAGLVGKTHVGNKAIEALLSSSGQNEIERITGHKDAGDARYRVYDKDNKAHDVTLAEAERNPVYRAQLVSGRANLLGKGGKHDLHSVSEVTDIKSKSQAVADGDDDKKGGRKTLIGLTPQAARLFQFEGPSNSQRKGVPGPGWLNPSSYPNYGGN